MDTNTYCRFNRYQGFFNMAEETHFVSNWLNCLSRLIHNPFQTPCSCSWFDVGQLSSVASIVSDLSPVQPLQECTSPIQLYRTHLFGLVYCIEHQWTCQYHELLQLYIGPIFCKNEQICNPLSFQNCPWKFSKQGQFLLLLFIAL